MSSVVGRAATHRGGFVRESVLCSQSLLIVAVRALTTCSQRSRKPHGHVSCINSGCCDRDSLRHYAKSLIFGSTCHTEPSGYFGANVAATWRSAGNYVGIAARSAARLLAMAAAMRCTELHVYSLTTQADARVSWTSGCNQTGRFRTSR